MVPAFEIEQHPATVGGQDVDPFFGCLPFTYPINAIGHAAASIPMRLLIRRHAHRLHIVGRKGDEETVIAAAFERTMPWADKRPAVS